MILKVTSADGALEGGGEICETRSGPQRLTEKNKASAWFRTLQHTIWSHPTRSLEHRSVAILWLVVVQRHIAKLLAKCVSGKTLEAGEFGSLIDVANEKSVRSSAFQLWHLRDLSS
jgi:hypothetical protein